MTEEVKQKVEELIKEGLSIKDGITLPSGTWAIYKLNDNLAYETWKDKTERTICKYFPNDISIENFSKSALIFEKNKSPENFDRYLGILASLLEVSEVISKLNKQENKDVSNFNIHMSQMQKQEQNQDQHQKIILKIFLEAISDEITGKQKKELQAIVKEEADPEKAKSKIVEKLKSFGSDVLSNIVSNIITNPAIWSGLMG